MREMKRINQIVDKAKTDLFEYFSMYPNVVWKEEDLQSYLYHCLLVIEPKLKKRLHREYPVIKQFKPRDWAGMLDLAITEEYDKKFCVEDVKIDCAIELKFMRNWRTGSSPKSPTGFEKQCIKDAGKLTTKAKNFKEDTKKYFWAFRLINTPQIDAVQKILKRIKWNDIEWSYIECYADGSEYEIIHK
ncbi:MAG: hypothetical protein L6265_09640 [Thermoplasmatales archaeon]|nr:hypothetical protein [Thermoplasmatales archaeon]